MRERMPTGARSSLTTTAAGLLLSSSSSADSGVVRRTLATWRVMHFDTSASGVPSPQPRKFIRSASVTMPTRTPPDVTGSCEMPRSRIFSTTSRSVSVSSATTIDPLRATMSSTRPSIARVWKKPLSRIHLSSTNLVM